MDGGDGAVGAGVGYAIQREELGSAVEACGPAACHAGSAVAASAGGVDGAGRPVARSLASLPHFERADRDVVAGSVRISAAILSGPGAGSAPAGVAPGIRDPEAFANAAGAKGKAGDAGQPGGRSGQ